MGKLNVETFQRFLEKDPANIFARYSLAMEYRKAGNLEEALTEFREVIAREAGYIPVYFMVGQTAVEAGKLDEAKELLAAGIDRARAAGESHAADKMSELLATLT
jgi:thioredoxin-like negative regulator of GroEL